MSCGTAIAAARRRANDLVVGNVLGSNLFNSLAVAGLAYHYRDLRLDQLAGAARHMPWTGAALVVCGFSLIGVPGTAGFISKWFLCLGAIEAGLLIFLAVIWGVFRTKIEDGPHAGWHKVKLDMTACGQSLLQGLDLTGATLELIASGDGFMRDSYTLAEADSIGIDAVQRSQRRHERLAHGAALVVREVGDIVEVLQDVAGEVEGLAVVELQGNGVLVRGCRVLLFAVEHEGLQCVRLAELLVHLLCYSPHDIL